MDMFYWIWLKDRKGKLFIYEDSLLPGIIPRHQIEHTSCEFVEKLGICETCHGTLAHVIEEGTGRKFCPVLFHDVVKPKWKARDLV